MSASIRDRLIAVRPHFRSAAEELVTKLINGGYLQPALRDDPDAITTAIVRLKEDLRGEATMGVLKLSLLSFASGENFDVSPPLREPT